MLCPLELCNHPPCDGERVARKLERKTAADGTTTIVRVTIWQCPRCHTMWGSEEVETHVKPPEEDRADVRP